MFCASAFIQSAHAQDKSLDDELDGRNAPVVSSKYRGENAARANDRRRRDWDDGYRDNDRDRGIFTCRSGRRGSTFCAISGSFDDVVLVARIGDRRCRRGVDWGTTRRGIWVDNGCAGRFEAKRYNQRRYDRDRDWDRRDDYRYQDNRRYSGLGRQYDRDGDGLIHCSARDGRYRVCAVPPRTSDVRLVRQRSRASCRRGRDWGLERNGIWVNNGCRADFAVEFRRGGRRGGQYSQRW